VYHYLLSETGRHEIHQKTKGSVRFRLYFDQLAKIKIPVPKALEVQQRFVNACNRLEGLKRMLNSAASAATDCLNAATRSGFLHEDDKSSDTSTENRAA
jgi:type I restriction enzyme M protein